MDVWLAAILSGAVSGVVGGACGAAIALKVTAVRQTSHGSRSPNIASGRDTKLRKP
jgi:hypothetical protein